MGMIRERFKLELWVCFMFLILLSRQYVSYEENGELPLMGSGYEDRRA